MHTNNLGIAAILKLYLSFLFVFVRPVFAATAKLLNYFVCLLGEKNADL